MNIAGVVIYASPHSEMGVKSQLAALPGVEVHAVTDEGKMVVTIENLYESDLADTVMQMQSLQGVLSASMVYHHNENHINVGDHPNETV